MEAKAVARYIRVSPRKVRQVANMIKGKDILEAQAVLKYTPKRGAGYIAKVLQSAVANAEHNYEMDPDNMYVANAYVDQGPTLKRFMPRAMGRADKIRKRTSHITVVVREKEEVN
ncbi:50S ribosomal protein L22 [Metallumcola ferriviriculae]|uniref:Large ribosomal subunit protein uL22 n=1 Tax=Metallumcola ferriviriculae TaxID=3039180 RepID=A0AAU0UKH4_9FIRM|nr:50S ribosomal protein L22 [Desulfitibacteraceae bacterium MK1]